MTFTLAITNFNRWKLLLESFAEVINDPRIGEVLIMDDCSNAATWNKIRTLSHPKIRAMRQLANRGMMENKKDAIGYASNEWVIIFDSDNILKPDYLNAIPTELDPNIIYMPDFAWPHFDYRELVGKHSARSLAMSEVGTMAINTCNYLVHRDTYLHVYQHNPEMKGTDTIYFAYLWHKSERGFIIVPGMTYFHRVHPNSGFLQDLDYNMKQAERIKKLIEKV